MHLDPNSQPLFEEVSILMKINPPGVKLKGCFGWGFKHLSAHYMTCAMLWEGISKRFFCKIRYQELRSIVTPAHGDKLLFVTATEQGYQSPTLAKN